ncbi:MAG: DNA-binding response regulator [Coriobacteriaceae bacterium]|nr:DNA-binding response regulator [Coriobacteriaceae bacterium]
MPTVLVVDDEANIRELVGVYLTAAGFSVEQAATGEEGLRLARSLSPDLVVLDIMLPGIGGLELCRLLRASSRVPIVMLTARDSDKDKVALLEAGADDYVTKPFSPAELVARVRAVMRRTAPAAASVRDATLVLGGLGLEPDTREVTVDGVGVTLTAKEFDLLATMLAEPGVVFPRERLLERAWGFSDYVEARGIDVHIRHLREKLGDDASAPRFIETVRGVGYRIRKDGG